MAKKNKTNKIIFFFSIFTLILASALLPSHFISAQSGTCYDANGNIINLAGTPSQCQSLGGVWLSNNQPPSPSPSPSPSSSSGGNCSYLSGNPQFQDLLRQLACIINNSVVPLIFSVAVVIFIWGVVQYVINNSEEAKKARGKQFMIWGIIGLTVMVSVWGLVRMATGTFGINFVVPQLQTTP